MLGRWRLALAAAAMLCVSSTSRAAEPVQPEDFRALVKPAAQHIETTYLVATVTARGGQAFSGEGPSGTTAEWRRQVDQGRPMTVLIEPTPGRFHYVVVVGVAPSSVVYHDPARTSSHVGAADEFDHEWRGSLNWRLVVLPPPNMGDVRSIFGEPAPTVPSAPVVPQAQRGTCGALVDRGVALADIDSRSAERALTAASEWCPASADPWLELAGLRFRARLGTTRYLADPFLSDSHLARSAGWSSSESTVINRRIQR